MLVWDSYFNTVVFNISSGNSSVFKIICFLCIYLWICFNFFNFFFVCFIFIKFLFYFILIAIDFYRAVQYDDIYCVTKANWLSFHLSVFCCTPSHPSLYVFLHSTAAGRNFAWRQHKQTRGRVNVTQNEVILNRRWWACV